MSFQHDFKDVLGLEICDMEDLSGRLRSAVSQARKLLEQSEVRHAMSMALVAKTRGAPGIVVWAALQLRSEMEEDLSRAKGKHDKLTRELNGLMLRYQARRAVLEWIGSGK